MATTLVVLLEGTRGVLIDQARVFYSSFFPTYFFSEILSPSQFRAAPGTIYILRSQADKDPELIEAENCFSHFINSPDLSIQNANGNCLKSASILFLQTNRSPASALTGFSCIER